MQVQQDNVVNNIGGLTYEIMHLSCNQGFAIFMTKRKNIHYE